MKSTLTDHSHLTGFHPTPPPTRSRSHLTNRPAAQGKSVSPALGRVSSVVVFRFRVYEMACRLALARPCRRRDPRRTPESPAAPQQERPSSHLPPRHPRTPDSLPLHPSSPAEKPHPPSHPKTLINYSKILSPFMKQRTYPRLAAHKLSTNGHPPLIQPAASVLQKGRDKRCFRKAKPNPKMPGAELQRVGYVRRSPPRTKGFIAAVACTIYGVAASNSF